MRIKGILLDIMRPSCRRARGWHPGDTLYETPPPLLNPCPDPEQSEGRGHARACPRAAGCTWRESRRRRRYLVSIALDSRHERSGMTNKHNSCGDAEEIPDCPRKKKDAGFPCRPASILFFIIEASAASAACGCRRFAAPSCSWRVRRRPVAPPTSGSCCPAFDGPTRIHARPSILRLLSGSHARARARSG